MASQTLTPNQVIIVFDEPACRDIALPDFPDTTNILVICTGGDKGANYARNLGTQLTNCAIVAFLDDDDLWFPIHLADHIENLTQTAAAISYSFAEIWPIHGPGKPRYSPRRALSNGEDVSEYLFKRASFRSDEGRIQTSTIVTRRDFAITMPLDNNLRIHQDWDWVLRIAAADESITCVPHPTIRYVDHNQSRISTSHTWQDSLEWAQARRGYFTARAWTDFQLFVVGGRASKSGALAAVPAILKQIDTRQITLRTTLIFMAMFGRNLIRRKLSK